MFGRRPVFVLTCLGLGGLLIYTIYQSDLGLTKAKLLWKTNMDLLWFSSTPKHIKPLSDDITIVTAYFNIGNFFKARKDNVRGPNEYLSWMKVFSRIRNPVVAFFDDEQMYANFTRFRSKFPYNTKTILVKRKDLWSFGLRDRIADIFRTPGYPQHLPNTVVPEYSCIMHAKFEFLLKVAEENYFGTKYISWLDVGLFRFDTKNFSFGLWLPSNFDPQKVSYSQVGEFNNNLTPQKIVVDNIVWVSGAMNLARMNVMKNFTRDYIRFVNYCLDSKFISTDQQVIYGMYSKFTPERAKPSVQIQPYTNGPGDVYFQLGYICREEWFKKRANVSTKSTRT